jgi:hypothetical protein
MNQQQMQKMLEMQKQQRMQQQQIIQRQLPNPNQNPNQNQYRKNLQDIERAKVLYNQRFIDQNYNRHDVDLNNEDDEDDDEDDDSDEEIEIKTYQENPHFIVISSFDRNWEDDNTNTTQYNFQLKFSPSSNTINNIPLYYNNPTIPATVSQAARGLKGDPNISGWTDKSGYYYPAYRRELPYGEIVGVERIVELGQRGLSLYNSFKNIVSVELLGVMMPSVQRQIDYSATLQENVIQETYFTVEIEEINDVMEGTSKNLSNAFAVITPYIRIYDSANSSSKTIEYKIAGGWAKKFIPTPLSSLTNLTMKMKKPSGDILMNINDTLDPKFIYQNTYDSSDDRNNILIIRTKEYFSDTEYKSSDTIIFRNYSHYKSNESNCAEFNNFINREKGHRILATSSSDPTKFMRNQIHIARPAYLDKTTGGLTEEPWYTIFKTDVLDTPSTINLITSFDSGRFINMDLQNVYFLKIITKEQNMTIESERV